MRERERERERERGGEGRKGCMGGEGEGWAGWRVRDFVI